MVRCRRCSAPSTWTKAASTARQCKCGFHDVTASLCCPNLAHRGARINRASQTGAALPAWEPIWKCLAGVFFGICAQGYVTGAGASLGPFGIATSGSSAVRKREGDRRGGEVRCIRRRASLNELAVPANQSPSPNATAPSLLVHTLDEWTTWCCAPRSWVSYRGSLTRTLWGQDTGFAP